MGLNEDSNAFERRFILQAFYDKIPVAMFFLLPIFALILKVLYRKRQIYTHHLVFSFYYFSFLFTVFSIILGINFIWNIPDWIDLIIMLSCFVYLVMAIKQFYNQGWFKSFFKTTITTFLFLLLVSPLTVVVLGVFAFLFY